LTASFVFLHAIEHQGTIQSGLVADFDVLIWAASSSRRLRTKRISAGVSFDNPSMISVALILK
jgi:hypothetical protein